MNTDLITKIVELLLTIIIMLLSAYVIPWIKTRIGAEKMKQLEQFCEAAVRAAEQLYTPDQWKQKKEYVLQLVTDKITSLGIGLNEAEVDAIIEGVVNFVKHNKE